MRSRCRTRSRGVAATLRAALKAASAAAATAAAGVVLAMTLLLLAAAGPARVALADDVWPAGTYPAWAAEACPAGGSHVFTSQVLSEPGEEADGVRLYACTKCGQAFEEAIPHTGHDWGPWVVDVEPTCVSAGSEHRECRRFEAQGQVHYEYRAIPALSSTGEHTWGGWVVDSEPSADEDGSEHRTCSVCGATETRAIPATGEAVGDDPTPEAESPEATTESAMTPEPETEPATSDATPVEPAVESADDGPAMLGPFILSFEPNIVDEVVWTVDGAVIAGGAVLLAPLLVALAWLRRRKREARERYLAQAKNDEEGWEDVDS